MTINNPVHAMTNTDQKVAMWSKKMMNYFLCSPGWSEVLLTALHLCHGSVTMTLQDPISHPNPFVYIYEPVVFIFSTQFKLQLSATPLKAVTFEMDNADLQTV